jgi:hypothetical protein
MERQSIPAHRDDGRNDTLTDEHGFDDGLAGELPDAGLVNEPRAVGVLAVLTTVAEVLPAEAAPLSGLSAETSTFIMAASFVRANLMLAEKSFFVRATDDHLRQTPERALSGVVRRLGFCVNLGENLVDRFPTRSAL